jgi:outer membrane protein assembly factor BamD (BamD/ComL family)
VLVLDPEGKERWRLEGYLSKDEFHAFLEMGLARVAFMKKDWADAERHYTRVIEGYPESHYAPQAVYYRGVSRYSVSHNSTELANTTQALAEAYPDTEWHLRSLPWLREKTETTTG